LKKYLHKTVLFIAYILWTVNAFAQSNAIDSLEKVLQSEKEDTNKVITLNAISEEFRFKKHDYKNALQYAESALSLAQKINYIEGKGTAELQLGKIHENQRNYPEAIKEFNSALSSYQEINDKKDIGQTYLWIGLCYADQELYSDALSNYQIALKLYQEVDDTKDIATVYGWIGRAYTMMGMYSDAISNDYLALKLFEKIGDKENVASSLDEIGADYYYQGNYPEALKSYQACLKIEQEIGDKVGIAHCMTAMGGTYTGLGNYAKALLNDSAALKIYQALGDSGPGWGITFALEEIADNDMKIAELAYKIGDKPIALKRYSEALKNYYESLDYWKRNDSKAGIAINSNRIAFIQIKLKNFAVAKSLFQKSLQQSTVVSDKMDIRDSYQGLAILDSINGNYKQSYEHYKLYILYRDSLINNETTKKSLQAKMQYESDKKEAAAKALQDKKDAEAKRIRNLHYFAIAALAVLAFVILLIAFIQWRNNKHKQKANALLQQQKEKVESTLTELKSTQAQLIQSEKMASLGELTAGIAHEIQNPLNFVNNFSEVNTELIDELSQEAEKGNIEEVKAIASDIKENEQKINHHGKRADAIVKGMLQHSRASTGVKEPTDINALADEYLRLAYHGLRAKEKTFNAELKTDFDNSIGKINIIPQDIGRVLLNLYNNAFYAVNEKKKQHPEVYEPTVSVSTTKIGNQITIIVKDNGNGIPQKAVDKIFQPFFTTKPTGQGTGLGLSLSYDIIKAHGGELKVDTKEGEYAEFVILLPV